MLAGSPCIQTPEQLRNENFGCICCWGCSVCPLWGQLTTASLLLTLGTFRSYKAESLVTSVVIIYVCMRPVAFRKYSDALV